MKIGIDLSQVIYGGGVPVYTRNLFSHLLLIDDHNDYCLLGGSLRRLGELKTVIGEIAGGAIPDAKVNIKTYPLSSAMADFCWNKIGFPPIETLAGELDVFHSSDWAQPSAKKAKLITTIHDLGFLRFPELADPHVVEVQKRRLQKVKDLGVSVIAVSEATKKETVELLGIKQEKISVIYEATPADAVNFQFDENSPASKELRLRLGIHKPYFVAYGSQAPRKNIKRIIEAFNIVKRKINFQLVIVGEYSPTGKLPKEAIVTGFLPRLSMLDILAGSSGLLFPSLYEGFGLIILEAFTLGVPVLTSDLSSMPEVAGGSAILVDPSNTEAIADGINRLLKNKGRLVKAGKKQASLFSWEKSARQTLKFYEKILGFAH